jgi:hypothetical protein
MKVKIVSGNQAGLVQDLPQVEAEVAVATGYAVAVTEEIGPAEVVVIPAPVPATDPVAPAADTAAPDVPPVAGGDQQ